MAYTPNSLAVYIAAYAGSLSGMAMSGRWVELPHASTILNYTIAAGAFAQEFDTLYGGSSDTAPVEAIQMACEAVWEGRTNASHSSDPTFYEGICQGIIDYITGLLDYFAGQGIPTNVPNGTAIAPLANVRFVDAESAVADPDGSIAKPYLNVQAAFDDLVAIGNGRITIMVTPSSNGLPSGDLAIPGTFDDNLCIVGMSANQISLETNAESTGWASGAHMGTITCADGALGNLRIAAQNIEIDGLVAVAGEGAANPVRFMSQGCQVGDINAPAGRIFAMQSTLGSLVCTNFYLYQMQVNQFSPPTLTATGGGTVDYDTYETYVEAGLAEFPNGTVVTGGAQSAILTVTVPALATSELGYADVDTTGTLLEGLTVRDIISGNPNGDLAAAGAGNGGFMNCRVSADHTIRCAFIGALAGGATSFLFSKDGRYIPPPS